MCLWSEGEEGIGSGSRNRRRSVRTARRPHLPHIGQARPPAECASPRCLRERLVILLDEWPEFLGHFVGSGQRNRARIPVDLATQAELETLLPLRNERLQTSECRGVLIHALVLELLKRLDDLVELARVDLLAAEQVAKRFRVVCVLSR